MTFLAFVALLGVRLTRAQRVLALVAYDRLEPGALTGADRELARRLLGDVDVIPPAARAVFVAVCGARGGKSYVLGGLYALWRALVADLSSLAPGEVATALVVAPDLRLARQVLRYALGAAQRRSEIAALIETETSDGFVLRRPDGYAVAIEVLPATRGGSALRGRSLVCAILDECAFFRDESAVVNDAEVFRAVAPRVIPGGLVVVVSTPWAESGLLFDLFSEGFGHPTTALVAHAPTTLLRDDARTASMVERERQRDPDNAAREFDAVFMGAGSGLFFPHGAVSGALIADLLPRTAAEPGTLLGLGGDLALVRDSSALCAVHVEGSAFVVAELLELRPTRGSPLRLSLVVAAFCELAQRHRAAHFFADGHAREPAREHLTSGIELLSAPEGQARIDSYVHARTMLNEGRVRIPAQYRRLTEQLRAVVTRPTPGGGVSVASPRRGGAHGDLVSAFVLALHAAEHASHPVDIRVGGLGRGRAAQLRARTGWT